MRRRTPALEGKTVNLFNADPSGLYAIKSGRAVISAERYDLLDSDLLVGISTSPQALAKLGRDKLFRRLDAVRDGRYVSLPLGPATAMAFPSLRTVRHATASVVPKLEQAFAGRGES